MKAIRICVTHTARCRSFRDLEGGGGLCIDLSKMTLESLPLLRDM